jgi:pimeloyl-ACP methyl ester carboxylesterase
MGEHRLDLFRGGTGEPLVLLHGLFESWHAWSPVLERLTAQRDVLAFTHLGHAGSPPFEAGQPPTIAGWTDAVEAELDSARLERPDIAGHSLGGWVAMELAKRGRAGSVVAVSPAGRYSDGEIDRIVRLMRRNYRMAHWLLPIGRRVVRTRVGRRILLADSCADPTRIPPDDAERLVVDLATCSDAEGFLRALQGQNGEAVRFDGARSVRCPVLIALPEEDRFFTRFHAERYAEELPEARIGVLPDCGHNAMFDHPELVGSTILSFVAMQRRHLPAGSKTSRNHYPPSSL